MLGRNRLRINVLVVEVAERRDVRVYRYANVGNHLHLLIQARSRNSLRAFLRELAGRIANLMTGAIKGRPAKFWDGLAFTKIIEWGRQFKNAARYVLLNFLEAAGHRDRKKLARLERDGILWLGAAD
jgi:REP element-mobilizing transposase RayT